MREVAKHLEAMGRHGDTALVHMSPQEVSALHGIASINGTHLTTNPHTGLPEAFSLGGFFKSLLPTIVGAVAAPLTGGTSMLIPVMAGAATGAALNGKDPLMGALMGGLGGFGGAGIGNALSAGSTASTAAQGANTVSNAATAAENAIAATPNVTPAFGGAGEAMGTTTSFGVPSEGITQVQQLAGQDAAARSLANSAMQAPAPTGLASLGTSAGRDAFVKSLGGTGPNADLIAAGKVAMPLGMAGLAGIEPPQMPQEKEDKYDPYATLNLNTDSGLRFFAEGGDVNETPDPGSNPIQDAQEARSYGIGGLSYADGGGIFGGPSLNLGTAGGANFNNSTPGKYSPAQFEQMYNAYNKNQIPMAMASGIRFRQTGLSPEQTQFNEMMRRNELKPNGGMTFRGISAKPSEEQMAFNQQLQDYNKARTDYYKGQSPLNGFGGIYAGGARKPLNIWQGNTAMPSAPGPFAGSSGAKFAKGGYLDGPGDGMSDSIPASIEGKQPARLADGEFVVPADVVSHLGNGSTKAGAERLYAMMDKVRHARTGTTKQGRQINPKKYLPA
jgi:hypothetical protein